MFDYDSFCALPEAQLHGFLACAAPLFGELPAAFDLSVAAEAHAGGKVPPVATRVEMENCSFVHARRSTVMLGRRSGKRRFLSCSPGIDAIRQRFPDAIVATHPV